MAVCSNFPNDFKDKIFLKKPNLNEEKYAETQLDNPVGAQQVT